MVTPFYQDDLTTIYHGDCRIIVPQLDHYDLLLTDPPYGLAPNSKRRMHSHRDPAKHGGHIGASRLAETKAYGETDYDFKPMDKEAWDIIRVAADIQCVWGFNHLIDVLGKPPRMLVWDKKCKNDWDDYFSDCESGWFSVVGPDKMFRWLWMGMIQKEPEKRLHPNQKPIALMKWCIRLCKGKAKTILDPYAGAGTTAVAARELGLKCVLIEESERWCNESAERLKALK